MRTRVAIVGAGITGLSAAYKLRSACDVTVFEADSRAGGHANSVEVQDRGRTIGVDTAFMVFNEPYYPRVTEFFEELGVSSVRHVGGFSFYDNDAGWQYTSEDLQAPLGESAMDSHPALASIKLEAQWFHETAPKHFLRGQANLPLGEYLEREGYSEDFKWGFVVLICSAAWAVPAERIWEMTAATVIAFYIAHGSGGLGGQKVDWRSVEGGSIRYVERAVAALERSGAEVRLSCPVERVREIDGEVEVVSAAGTQRFDRVVMALHADDGLRLVEGLAADRAAVLGKVPYSQSRVLLHTDPSVMPADRASWRSWNYGRRAVGDDVDAWVVFYMNALQSLDADQDYFVTLGYPGEIDEERLLASFDYRHPVINFEVRSLQEELWQAAMQGPITFCGGYLHSRKLGKDIIGMHESAFDSGLAAAEGILSRTVTPA